MNVTFCGNRHINEPDKIIKWLNDVLPVLIDSGANKFYLGNYGDFDYLAALALKFQKRVHKNINSILVLAYPEKKFELSLYDQVVYPPIEDFEETEPIQPGQEIIKCNQFMITKSDIVISGVIHNVGKPAQTLAYAQKQNKVILQYPFYTIM